MISGGKGTTFFLFYQTFLMKNERAFENNLLPLPPILVWNL